MDMVNDVSTLIFFLRTQHINKMKFVVWLTKMFEHFSFTERPPRGQPHWQHWQLSTSSLFVQALGQQCWTPWDLYHLHHEWEKKMNHMTLWSSVEVLVHPVSRVLDLDLKRQGLPVSSLSSLVKIWNTYIYIYSLLELCNTPWCQQVVYEETYIQGLLNKLGMFPFYRCESVMKKKMSQQASISKSFSDR